MMRGARAPLAVALALELIMFLPGLLQAGIYLRPPPNASNEGLNQFLIFRQYWREQVQAGHLPLWNPYGLGGIPFLADPQTATLYPFTLLLLLPVGVDTTLKLSAVLHVLLGTSWMYLLCRALGASRWGAALGGYAFGFSPQMVMFVFGGWVHHMATASWAPGVLWAFVRAMDDGAPRARFVGVGGLLLGLQLLAGHPEWAYYTLLALAALALAFAIRRGTAGRLWPLVAAAALVVIGVCLAAPQLVPTVEATVLSTRGQAVLEGDGISRGLGLPVAFLPSLVVPKVFGPWDLQVSVDSWMHRFLGVRTAFGESLAYCGILTLVLALVGVKSGNSRLNPAVWGWLAGGALVMALNDVTHVRSALEWLVPAIGLFRSPVRFVFLFSFSLCVLASLGATRAMEGSFTPGPRFSRCLSTAAVVMALAGAGLVLLAPQLAQAAATHIGIPEHLRDNPVLGHVGASTFAQAASRWGGIQIVWAALLVALTALVLRRASRLAPPWRFAALLGVLAIDLIAFAWPFLTSVERPQQYYEKDLRQLAAFRALPDVGRVSFDDDHVLRAGPSVPMLARLRTVGGYEAYRLQAYEQFFTAAERAPEAYLAVFGATHRVRDRVERRIIPEEAWTITRVGSSLPRAYWTDRVVVTATPGQALARLPELVGVPAPGVFLHGCGDETPMTATDGPVASPQLAVDEPEHLALTSESAREGWLVLNEMYYPGWRAWVDGVETPVCQVNAVMRGVRVPAGRHRVDFRFRPTRWSAAWAASATGLAISALLICAPRRSKGGREP